MVSFTLEATASLSISPEGEQVRVKSSIYLGGRLLTCPADVRSRSKKSVPSELKCGRQLKKKWAGKREEGKRERGFSRKADKAGKKERERKAKSRPISVWSPELGDGLGKSAEVAGLSLPIAVRRREGSKDK